MSAMYTIICATIIVLPMQYGVVIDAGSSHTSFYLYEWYLPKSNSTGVVFETAVCPGDGELTVCLQVCMLINFLIKKPKHHKVGLM